MNLGDEYEVTIEKLTNPGTGFARADGFVVFIENTCPGDRVRIKISKITKNYAKAKLLEVLEASAHRIKPFCPLQKVCGACQIQFIDYGYQLELKRQIVQEVIHRIGGIDIEIPLPVSSPEIKCYRHKIQYAISETSNSKRILAGYYKPSTHEIVNIKYCPIQPEVCDKIIEFIREYAPKYGVHGYNEKSHNGDLRHVVIRNSVSNGNNLVVLVVNALKTTEKLNAFARAIYKKFDEVCGVCINYNTRKTNVIMGAKTEKIIGKDYIEEEILGKTFFIGGNTFFQVNPVSAENIFQYVKDYIAQNFNAPLVLDAYAGISAFGICVSDVCSKVVTIEENNQSAKLAERSAKLNNITNVEIHAGDAGEYFSKEKRKFDAIILDPPRKGCTQQSLDEAFRLCKNTIIYVSCNPATLARDLKYLRQKGCTIQSVKPFDMFCHTYHVESVALICK